MLIRVIMQDNSINHQYSTNKLIVESKILSLEQSHSKLSVVQK